MKAIAIGRTALFCSRYPQAWISADASWDYYSFSCSVSFATLLIGIQYVWKESRHGLKKDAIGMEWHPKF